MSDSDPADLDRWDAVETCPKRKMISDGDLFLVVHCENEAGHEPPCSATLYWADSSQEAEQ